ncbi:DUF4383 domain-containing protein [Saccharothrix deserti]|uniref:DUF4383 domain-containing protein n=1 Tax=Saccharothrix deserti TaxID=2593674 RepID=UPI00131EAB1D|nr:DUF4383 domain-containing protein [Saccharothrix deserti]
MSRTEHATRSPVQIISAVVGVVFLLVGVAGFIPGLVVGYDALEFAGPDSGALLLGLFQVSILHNAVHLAFGVAGLALAQGPRGARLYLIGGGIVYLALWFYGLAVEPGGAANVVPLNTADNWLHLGLGVGMIVLGLVPGRRSVRGRP